MKRKSNDKAKDLNEEGRKREGTRSDKAEDLHNPEDAAAEGDDSISAIHELVDQCEEYVSILVINRIGELYHNEGGFFRLVQRYGTPAKCLLHLLDKNQKLRMVKLLNCTRVALQ